MSTLLLLMRTDRRLYNHTQQDRCVCALHLQDLMHRMHIVITLSGPICLP